MRYFINEQLIRIFFSAHLLWILTFAWMTKQEISFGERVFRIYLDETQIQTRIRELAAEIQEQYRNTELVIVSVLNGAFMFTADLLRKLDIPCNLNFIRVSSYSGTETTGQVKTVMGLGDNMAGKHILLIEDIVDTGITLKELLRQLQVEEPASIRVCALLVKPEKHQVPVNVDYPGFVIPDAFVVGYGLDLDGQGRNLPHIYQLKS